MRKEVLLEAIGDVDDDLLERSEGYRATTKRPLRIAALVAAAMMLLTVTVFAVTGGIEYWFGTSDQGLYNTISFAFPLEPVEISEQAYEELTDMMASYYQTGGYIGTGSDISSVANLEAYLGIDLALSPEIEAEAIARTETIKTQNAPGTSISISPLGLPDASYTGPLKGIRIQIYLKNYAQREYAGVRIFIPFTEDGTEAIREEVWHSTQEDGTFSVSECQISGRTIQIVQNESNTAALALYTDGGIGYYVYVDSHSEQQAVERLMELIEHLE